MSWGDLETLAAVAVILAAALAPVVYYLAATWPRGGGGR